jgi:hypothetical protein
MAAFIDRLGPRDLMLLARPLDSLVALRMTRDREAVKRMVAQFEGRKGRYEARTAFERSLIAGNASRNEAVRAQIVTSALNALATHLGSLNGGRKALLFVSEGFPRVQRRRGEGPLPTIDAVIRSADRANVAIYPIDPSNADREMPNADREMPNADREMLAALATETDGHVIRASPDLAPALEPIIRDTSAYYMLTLPAAADGRFHPLSVRVRKPGVRLRAPKGYWAATADDLFRARLSARSAAPPAPPELPRRTSPLIRPWFGLSPGADGSTRVSFVWEAASRVPGDRSRSGAPARIVLKALAADGTTLYEGTARAVTPGMTTLGVADTPAQLVFAAPPGRLRVQMLIEDVGSHVLDTDVRDVPVAAFSPAARVALGTARVMRARTAREYRALLEDADAVPTPAREFSRVERLLIRLPAYAAADRPAVSARLSSAIGGAMRDLAVTAAKPSDWYQIDLPLAGLATGAYTVEITAASDGASSKESVAFRVIP